MFVTSELRGLVPPQETASTETPRAVTEQLLPKKTIGKYELQNRHPGAPPDSAAGRGPQTGSAPHAPGFTPNTCVECKGDNKPAFHPNLTEFAGTPEQRETIRPLNSLNKRSWVCKQMRGPVCAGKQHPAALGALLSPLLR